MSPLPLQDGVQQHLLQSRDGHRQRGMGALQSTSLQQGSKDITVMSERRESLS